MQDHHVPSIGLTYWSMFLVASVFGVNLSDLIAVNFGLGPAGRVLLFAAIMLVLLVVERYDRSDTHAWYWVVIVAIQAAANKLADLSTDSLGFGRIEVIASLLVLLVVTYATVRSSAGILVERLLIARPGEARPMSDPAYWLAMIFASTLGAVASDLCATSLRFGMLPSMVVFALLLAPIVWSSRQPMLNRLIMYWIMVVLVRGLGTATADFMAKEAFILSGLATSTLLTGTMMVGGLLLWGRRLDGGGSR